MSSGRIIQIIGAVIDVEFARDGVPQVYDALTVDDRDITLECNSSWVTGLCALSLWAAPRFEPGTQRAGYRSPRVGAGRH